MSEEWRRRYFSGDRPRDLIAALGLVRAPSVERRSRAMEDALAENERLRVMRASETARIARGIAEAGRALAAVERAERQQQRDDEMRQLVAEFGAAAVLTIMRRVDQGFTLPPDGLEE